MITLILGWPGQQSGLWQGGGGPVRRPTKLSAGCTRPPATGRRTLGDDAGGDVPWRRLCLAVWGGVLPLRRHTVRRAAGGRAALSAAGEETARPRRHECQPNGGEMPTGTFLFIWVHFRWKGRIQESLSLSEYIFDGKVESRKVSLYLSTFSMERWNTVGIYDPNCSICKGVYISPINKWLS